MDAYETQVHVYSGGCNVQGREINFHCVASNIVAQKFGVGIHCCHLEIIFLTLYMYVL